MIDLPVGKAIIAEYSDGQCNSECTKNDILCDIDWCKGCDLNDETTGGYPEKEICGFLSCMPSDRKDGKHVIYRVRDYLVKEKRTRKTF